jgi:hypothetical protein
MLESDDDDSVVQQEDDGFVVQTTLMEEDSMELMIEKAALHIRQAKDMRAMFAGKQALSRQWYATVQPLDSISNELWSEAVDCLIGDYCQNMGLPYMGEHQPGETYYFSPLTVNCFGIANVGHEKADLTAYVYHEGEGKKGGCNVASLIYKYLDEQALIQPDRGPRKELNIVMDNCGGQNKNRFVIQLACLFVELHYYLWVNLIFLVAGHTKNAANRLFNVLKQDYCKLQV